MERCWKIFEVDEEAEDTTSQIFNIYKGNKRG